MCVYDENTAEACGNIGSNKLVQVFRTNAYNASPNYDIELTIGVQNVGGRGLQFVTVDGTIYPCDCVYGVEVGLFGVKASMVLSYGFTVDVQAKSGMVDSVRKYVWLFGARTVKCE